MEIAGFISKSYALYLFIYLRAFCFSLNTDRFPWVKKIAAFVGTLTLLFTIKYSISTMKIFHPSTREF